MVKVTRVADAVANAGTGAVTTSAAVNVQFAASLVVYVKAGAGGALQGTIIEQSYDGGATYAALDASYFQVGGGAAASVSAGATGTLVVVMRTADNPAMHSRGVFPATHMRAKTTGNSGAVASTVTVDIAVCWNSEGQSFA